MRGGGLGEEGKGQTTGKRRPKTCGLPMNSMKKREEKTGVTPGRGLDKGRGLKGIVEGPWKWEAISFPKKAIFCHRVKRESGRRKRLRAHIDKAAGSEKGEKVHPPP